MRRFWKSRVALAFALAADVLLYAGSPGPFPGGTSLEAALAAQEELSAEWLGRPGVVGTAVGFAPGGRAVVKVYLTAPGAAALPMRVDGVDVLTEVTGRFVALGYADEDEAADPTRAFPRPVPIGVSTGHPGVTAGTIGARVTDGDRVFALSNNHVYANNNGGRKGDNLLQPGVADGGRDPDDALGTLHDFEPIDFCAGSACKGNRMDAAVALTTVDDLGTETPDPGYGAPRSGRVAAELGQKVQKYGRTTGHTHGQITGIHAIIDVGYGGSRVARFEDQIVISGGGFSGPGDSGSLIVTEGLLLGDRQPVGLLFAGSNTSTLANPIGIVLDRFGVEVDGG